MHITEAQHEVRTRFVGGFYGQLVSGVLWLVAAALATWSTANDLRYLGMQAAFVLPLSMPLLLPVGLYRLDWFFPAMMVLLGAHYLPFVFLYGMRMFAVLTALLVGGGVAIARVGPGTLGLGAWYTGATLLLFAAVGRVIVRREARQRGG